MLSKLAIQRLEKLANYMEKLPKSAAKHFNMGTEFYHSGDEHHDFPFRLTTHSLTLCGTAACAMGHAATVPYFQKLGLSMDRHGHIQLVTKERHRVGYLDAAAAVFDIEIDQAWELFNSSLERTISTPKAWAKHCREFIKNNS